MVPKPRRSILLETNESPLKKREANTVGKKWRKKREKNRAIRKRF